MPRDRCRSCRPACVVTPEQEANRIVENMAAARHMDVARFLDRDTAIARLQAPSQTPVPDWARVRPRLARLARPHLRAASP